jgi:hypothetical protein
MAVVLIAEDDVDVSAILERLFTRAGFTVLWHRTVACATLGQAPVNPRTAHRRLPARGEDLHQGIGLSRRKDELDIARLVGRRNIRTDRETEEHAPIRVAEDLEIP